MTLIDAELRPSDRHPVRRSLLVVVLMATSMLGGCVVGPDYKMPDLPILKNWPAAAGKQALKPTQLAGWWKGLDDPLLNELVEEAVRGNLDVATAKANLRLARATTRSAEGALLPSLSQSDSATRTRNASGDVSYSTQYKAGFDASWEIDLFGGNRRSVEAARASEQAEEETLRQTLVTLVGDVASYYVEAREYQALIDLAERSAKSQLQVLALTRRQFEAGEATGMDVAKAAATAASTQADIPSYRISYAQAVHRLGILLGRTPDAVEARLTKPAPIPVPRRAMPSTIPAGILLNRPDVRAAERDLAAYTAKIGVAEAARYPSISLSGAVTTSAASVSDLARKSTIGWTLGPSVSIPLFQGGQLKAAVDEAKATRDKYFVAYQSAVMTAMEDTENAVIGLTQSRLRQDKLRQSVAGYRQAAELSRTLFQSGASGFLDVLDAETSLYSSQENYIQSTANTATYFISLNKALGGGWSGTIDADQPLVVDRNEGPHPQP
ncbi:efflux transporter outer membrane subunit [Rhizobium straminoryzae]|uniref:Efflux transporter outer membrane subunit n=1 Tax=Rhizobium straminoryzae TaxID=1387186 RepID=A0A549TFD2_9HYPH|nr:efflux transporter outer membrane subunit [Rhizobium straminoryzae]TRL41220.1 efflux transporter outer membrane subunit [Rhizobium straminoryzae]